MSEPFNGSSSPAILILIRRVFTPFVEITRRYHEPHIKMTRTLRFALLMLRLYLFFLVALLVVKFLTMVG